MLNKAVPLVGKRVILMYHRYCDKACNDNCCENILQVMIYHDILLNTVTITVSQTMSLLPNAVGYIHCLHYKE